MGQKKRSSDILQMNLETDHTNRNDGLLCKNFKPNVTHTEIKGQFEVLGILQYCVSIPDKENTGLSMWKQDKQKFRYCHHYISLLS